MKFRLTGLILAITAVAATFVLAQDTSTKKVRKVTAPYTSASSGKDMYNAYCASCHGADATGNGPAASALKAAPTDLTQLSKNNQSKFPADRVSSILKGTSELAAHGSADMPVWGPVFGKISQGHASEVQLRIANLTKYLESMQKK
jgi:mono/diheme cytochrome c family protein